MRAQSWRLIGKAPLAAFALAACGDDGPTQTCQRDTGESSLSGNVSAAYVARVTGDAIVSAVVYYTDEGAQTLANPVLPFSTTVQLATAHARIQATGDPGSGSIIISFRVTPEAGASQAEEVTVTCP